MQMDASKRQQYFQRMAFLQGELPQFDEVIEELRARAKIIKEQEIGPSYGRLLRTIRSQELQKQDAEDELKMLAEMLGSSVDIAIVD